VPRVRPQQRDTLAVRLPDGREVSVLRVVDPRARHLRLLMAARGPRLTVPAGAPLHEAQRFLERNLGWLADQLAEDPEMIAPPAALVPGEPGRVPLRGQWLDLDWRASRWLRVAQEGERLVIDLPPTAQPAVIRRALREFHLSQARADIGRWLPRYLPDLPRAPRLWRIRPLASLWGSMSASGTLSLDLALVLGPPEAFHYVLVHELCHLIQPNHSPAFWREVEHRFPGWHAQRRYLREDGLALKGMLRTLLEG
jgi:predicted metal-dependent hydrolase